MLAKDDAPKAEELSDKDLAANMKEGDDQAFEILYNRYFDPLYGFIVRRVGHAQIAEDILSDVFMKAFASRERFVWKTSFSAWLYRIAQNAITDYYRTKKSEEGLDQAEKKGVDAQAAARVDAGLLNHELEKTLETLDERDRLAITLRFYSQLSNAEIAQILGVSVNNVGVILFRSLKRCQQKAPPSLKAMM